LARSTGRVPGLLLAGVALGLAGVAVAGDLPEIQARGSLQVLTWSDNLDELFSTAGTGPPGLEREVLQGFAELRRLRLEVVPAKDPVAALLAGTGDMIAGGLVASEARRRQLSFTGELFPIRHVVVTRRPHPPVGSLEELRRTRVGTEKGTSWAEQVRAADVPAENVVDSFASTDAVLRALADGGVSATVMSVVWAMVAQKHDPSLELGLMLGAPTSVAFAARKEQPLLLAALDEYVANVRRTPTWSRLVVKYFGESGLEILRKSRQP
jgi:peptidoglycan lytic transglycosylase F